MLFWNGDNLDKITKTNKNPNYTFKLPSTYSVVFARHSKWSTQFQEIKQFKTSLHAIVSPDYKDLCVCRLWPLTLSFWTLQVMSSSEWPEGVLLISRSLTGGLIRQGDCWCNLCGWLGTENNHPSLFLQRALVKEETRGTGWGSPCPFANQPALFACSLVIWQPALSEQFTKF